MNNKRFQERTAKENLEIDVCDECGKEYQPVVWWQKHCSDRCRQIAYRKRNPKISPALLKDIEGLKKDNAAMKKKLRMK